MPEDRTSVLRSVWNGLCLATVFFLLDARQVFAQDNERKYDAILSGQITDITRPETVWLGAIEVRLRSPYVFEEKREDALSFMQALAPPGRIVECRLTGERTVGAERDILFGDCFVFGPTDGREISLGDRLIERGFARVCDEDIAVIQIWPPVFDCM